MKLIVLVKYESTEAKLQTLIDQSLFSEESFNTKEVVYLSNYIRKGFVYEIMTSRRAPSQIKLQFKYCITIAASAF